MADYLRFQKSSCKSCYKCIRHCPVKSIRFSGNQANVIPDECILCGQCYVVCPQNAKVMFDESEIVGVLLQGDAPVVASIAPSFAAYFPDVGIEALSEAMRKLGFHSAEETALGATIVKREYERLTKSSEMDVIITSCCHTVNLLIEKYYPELCGFLAPVVTPMKAHCDDIKRRIPTAKTVFVGPCLSKMDEAEKEGIDAVLTFDKLEAMFERANITLHKGRRVAEDGLARLFPTDGGILGTLKYKNPSYTYLSVDGLESCKRTLDDIRDGGVRRCFIEMSACVGSCIGGPIMEKRHSSPIKNLVNVRTYAGENDFDIAQPAIEKIRCERPALFCDRAMPSEAAINEILRKMDKFKPEDELNCGSCGYETCRKKAIAIYQGKAEITMCLPYLMEKSERFSNNILDNTPNGILVVNEAYEVQQINPAAMKMLRVRSRADVVGCPVVRLMDPLPFIEVLEHKKRVAGRLDYYAEFDRYLELTIATDRVSGNMIAIFRDVTDEQTAKQKKAELSRQTVETADRVVDKQMRIVQEIASLLGETAAETKIALSKLKESIKDDDE
ncbi:MAG: [Fe-Fe] hydrogenase large subunit C-terminal domain-containing protein [Clostridia bacterium]|nr:[Fe-Fe] hydrogenase large subunit C-terminal domain-containing protein [Clostridia bacterium]